MRTATNNSVTLKYPDAIGFAFNPCLLVVDSDSASKMAITVSTSEKSENINLDALAGKCCADVREYVQTFFDTMEFGTVDYSKVQKTGMGKTISFAVTVTKTDDTEATFSFDVFYVWGALKIGGQETYNGYRKLTWFRNFPFTFGVYAAGGGSILLSKDGVADRFVNLSEQGVWNIPMKSTDNAKSFYLVHDCTGAFVEVTFDSTFDMTFRYSGGGTKTKKIRIEVVDDYDEGYYLRWIDRHGFYCYYLFKAGDKQSKVTSDNLFMRNNLLAYDMSYGYQGYTGRQQQMSRTDSVPVCAPLVDSDTFDMLMDLVTSPCVDLFAGYRDGIPQWLSVTVAAGTFTKTLAELQDFVCKINLPDMAIQKL